MHIYIYIRVIYINIYIYTRARRGETIREKRGSGQKNDQRRTESERKGEKKWEYHSCTRMRTSGRQKEDSRLEREEKEREKEEK